MARPLPTSPGAPRPPAHGLLAALVLVALAAPARLGAEDPPLDLPTAQAALDAGRWTEARSAFQGLLDRAVAAGTSDAPALAPLRRGLGRALLGLDEPYEALRVLEPLAAEGGTAEDHLLYAEALTAHARANLAEGQASAAKVVPYLEDALAAARAAEGHPGLLERRLQVVGEANDLAGRTEAAVAAWQGVGLGTPPTPGQRWCRERLAHALYRLGRHREAAGAFESLGLRRAAAAAWAAAKDAERALAHYAALLAEHPDDGALLEEALSTARFTGTQTRLDEILASLPASPAGRVGLLRARARLAEQRSDYGTALAHVRAAQAAASRPSATLAKDLARLLVRSGAGGQAAREEAAGVLLEALGREPQDPDLPAMMLAIAQQDFADAWRAWPDRRPLARCVALQRAVLAGRTDDVRALQDLGNSLRLAGETEAAVATFEQALAAEPGDAVLRSDAGLAYGAARRPADAAAAFARARDDDPGLLAARQNLARASWRAGDDAAAQSESAAALVAARAAGSPWLLYRFLFDRAWRTRHRPERR